MPTAKRPNHRPPYAPSEKDRKTVSAMTAYGGTQDEIANVLGISEKTLRKYFSRELRTALAQANAQIAQRLFHKADKGDVVCMIFWLKTRAKWSERITVVDGGTEDVDPATLTDAELAARIARLSAPGRKKR